MIHGQILYHRSYQDLRPGVVIKPGNWGRTILETGKTHSWWESENILEEVRQKSYPEKPSRLQSAFAYEFLETALLDRNRSAPNDYIYSVIIDDCNKPWHRGDFNATRPMPRHYADMHQIADMYWQYKLKCSVSEWPGIICSEIVTLSSLTVVLKHDA